MTLEEHIRSEFEKALPVAYGYGTKSDYLKFKAGYMALLNSLNGIEVLTAIGEATTLYRLPEGVEK